MSIFSLQKFLTAPPPATVTAPVPLPVFDPAAPKPPGSNPFMDALKTDNPKFMATYGHNKPLEQPMFLGYRGNQPLYGGSRLFLLY